MGNLIDSDVSMAAYAFRLTMRLKSARELKLKILIKTTVSFNHPPIVRDGVKKVLLQTCKFENYL